MIFIFVPMLLRRFSSFKLEAGCDEAGRGCLAGPVFAAAVIFPSSYKNGKINDSKKLTHSDRMELREIIKKNALAYSIAFADPKEIDEINILNASILAMHRAVSLLPIKAEFLLIDGNRFKKYTNDQNEIVPHKCIVRGDGIYLSIAAASILAKTERDLCMLKLHEQYPHYSWNKNKGYGTELHRAAIEKYGFCPEHRKTFRLKSLMKV